MKRINFFIIVASLILILFSNLYYVSFDEDFYLERMGENEFNKVLDYSSGKIDFIEGDFFNSKEKLHLKDVRNLFGIVKILILSSLIILIFGYWYLRKKIFFNSVKIGCLILLVFILILLLLSLFDFTWLFLKFHELVFTNDLWLLSSEDNLIKLFPEEIFFDILKKLVVNVVVSSLVVLGLCKLNL